MPRKKDYVSRAVSSDTASISVNGDVPGVDAETYDIDLKLLLGTQVRNPLKIQKIYLDSFRGKVSEKWLAALKTSIETALLSGDIEIASAQNQVSGMRTFFKFLKIHLEVQPRDLSASHVHNYIIWLSQQTWSENGGRTRYQNTKSALVRLHQLGFILTEPKALFPKNPFPNATGAELDGGPAGYSESEQSRLADALKLDLSAIYHGRIKVIGSDEVGLPLLVVAMRSACGITQLLEMSRVPLSQGLVPGTMLLTTVKPRAHKIIQQPVRSSEYASAVDHAQQQPIKLDVVAVLQRVIDSTSHLAKKATDSLKNRVWLYRTESVNLRGEVTALDRQSLKQVCERLVFRHQIMADDGTPLKIAISRLRKSFANRGWRLSEGDPFAVSMVLNNTPKVAGLHYATMTQSIKEEAAQILNGKLLETLRGRTAESIVISPDESGAALVSKTPAARCLDDIHGQFAPSNGNHCSNFLACLFCKSFAVVGTTDDLWRLLSFQKFLRFEVNGLCQKEVSADVKENLALCRASIEFLDTFVADNFPKQIVNAAFRKVELGLHPFWKMLVDRASSDAI